MMVIISFTAPAVKRMTMNIVQCPADPRIKEPLCRLENRQQHEDRADAEDDYAEPFSTAQTERPRNPSR